MHEIALAAELLAHEEILIRVNRQIARLKILGVDLRILDIRDQVREHAFARRLAQDGELRTARMVEVGIHHFLSLIHI